MVPRRDGRPAVEGGERTGGADLPGPLPLPTRLTDRARVAGEPDDAAALAVADPYRVIGHVAASVREVSEGEPARVGERPRVRPPPRARRP